MRALTVAGALLLAVPAVAATPHSDAEAALAYLAGTRSPDGAFDPALAPLLVEAASAVGKDPRLWPDPQHPALDSVRMPGNGPLLARLRPAHAMALARGPDPALAEELLSTSRDGQLGEPGLLNDDAWGLISLHALGVAGSEGRLQSSAMFLAAHQGRDGGWSWSTSGTSETDMTGMVLTALASVHALNGTVPGRAAAFLEAQAGADGGYPASPAGPANCDSTVWAIQGLRALQQPVPPSAWAYLRGLRRPDGGFAYAAGQGSNTLCTAEAATLLGQALASGGDLPGYGEGAEVRRTPPAGMPLLTLGALALALPLRRRGWPGQTPRATPARWAGWRRRRGRR